MQSAYQLRNTLPNRSTSQRPRSLSLSEYQPLSFDRESLEAAYQHTIGLPSTSSASSRSIPSWSSFGVSGTGSADTHDTGITTPSLLPHELKRGDNPHGLIGNGPPPPLSSSNIAGVGAGHSLTPQQSPFHSAAKTHHASPLSPVPGSPVPIPPTPPARPSAIPDSTYALASEPHTGIGMRRVASAMDIDDGYSTDPGVSSRARGKRRALPALPTDVPAPEPPQWEPDIKPHIPSELTQPSIANAYARLSAPPPNLPPRRTQPLRLSASPPPRSTRSMGLARTAEARAEADAGPSTIIPPSSMVQPVASSSTAPPPGALDLPPTDEPMLESSSAPTSPTRPRPTAEKEIFLRATDKTPIWSTHYLDPCLHTSLMNVPHQVTNAANVALTGLSSGQKSRYNSTVGAPIDGMARAARDWIVPADAKFVSEIGGIEVGVAVVDGGLDGWGKEKGRRRARVEAISKQGGIKIDVIELDANRQIDLRIESKAGDVLVLLPDTFHGPIHITSPSQPPRFLPILTAQLEALANPYAAFFTTVVTPLRVKADPSYKRSYEHRTVSGIQRYTPKSFREQSDMLDQVVGGYAGHTRAEQSKVTIQSSKGRVVIGYRESADEEGAQGMGLVVGAHGPQRKKRWWR